MTVTEPKIKIVQVGESVTLRCNVQTSGLTDVVVTWNKENGVLPSNRVRSDTNGILISDWYSDAGYHKNGLANVEINGKWGYIDSNG